MEYNQKLKKLRDEIDLVDKYIYMSILKRFDITNKIGNLKKEHGVSEMSEVRRKEILKKLKDWAIEDGLPVHLITSIYEMILDTSTIEQTLIIHEKDIDYLP